MESQEVSAMFRPAAETQPQDWAALARHLAEHGMRLGDAPPRQFAGGFGNLNYLLDVDGKEVVLRRPPPGPLPPGANDMAREHRILSVLWRAFPLAPRGIHFCADPSVLGAPFQLIEYRPGLVIRESLPAPLAGRPDVGDKLSRAMVDALAELHAVDASAIGLDTLGRPAGFLARTLEGWATRGGAVADVASPLAFEETLRWLRANLPPERPPALLHSDFKLDNMIFDPATLAPVAVIDWDMGTRGDPLWDLAVLLSYWTEPGDPPCMHRMRQMPTAQPGFWSRGEALAAYGRRTGRQVDDFRFYRCLSVFRSAIVFLQLFDRYRRDPAPNSRFAEFDRLGREMLDFAFEISRGRAA
jgi:aminoglycoside phosphotransferase (APT) family kinase protein